MSYTTKQIERIKSQLRPLDTDAEYESFLDEAYEPVNIAGMTYGAGYALEAVDPTAFRCGVADHANAQCNDGEWVEIDGEHYNMDDVQNLLDDIENEADDATE